jgi:DNA ligase D-like protein (predicted polymerase)
MRIGRHDVSVSNPEKALFPARGLTKLDLVTYYLGVADHVLPHLRRRPFHMKRFPNGVDGDFFHQKRVPANHPDYVDDVFVQFPSGHSTVFAVVDNAAALAWVANLGCIEMHTWHSRVEQIENPDYLLIDLDPTSEGQWPFVREIALVVRDVLDGLGLRSYPKTSGATGLHVLAPIRPELEFPHVRRFAKAVAEEVERRIGDQRVATTTWRVADRVGVFVDFGQNARDRTIASAYSVRPTSDARVGSAALGRGRGGRAGGVHAGDDARAGGVGGRPDARHVAQPAVAAHALRTPRPRAARVKAGARRGGSARPEVRCKGRCQAPRSARPEVR